MQYIIFPCVFFFLLKQLKNNNQKEETNLIRRVQQKNIKVIESDEII